MKYERNKTGCSACWLDFLLTEDIPGYSTLDSESMTPVCLGSDLRPGFDDSPVLLEATSAC